MHHSSDTWTVFQPPSSFSLTHILCWSGQEDLNFRPLGSRPSALPDCAMPCKCWWREDSYPRLSFVRTPPVTLVVLAIFFLSSFLSNFVCWSIDLSSRMVWYVMWQPLCPYIRNIKLTTPIMSRLWASVPLLYKSNTPNTIFKSPPNVWTCTVFPAIYRENFRPLPWAIRLPRSVATNGYHPATDIRLLIWWKWWGFDPHKPRNPLVISYATFLRS